MELEIYNIVVGGFFGFLALAFIFGAMIAQDKQAQKRQARVAWIFGMLAIAGLLIPIGWLDGVLTAVGLLLLFLVVKYVQHKTEA